MMGLKSISIVVNVLKCLDKYWGILGQKLSQHGLMMVLINSDTHMVLIRSTKKASGVIWTNYKIFKESYGCYGIESLVMIVIGKAIVNVMRCSDKYISYELSRLHNSVFTMVFENYLDADLLINQLVEIIEINLLWI